VPRVGQEAPAVEPLSAGQPVPAEQEPAPISESFATKGVAALTPSLAL
jgi:hypothetical protein